jgi:hypothetical protein
LLALKEGGCLRLMTYFIGIVLLLSACSREDNQIIQSSSSVQKKVQSSVPSIDEPKRMFQ